MTILRKYVLREHAGPFFFGLATLTSLMLLNQIARRFGDLVGKGLGWSVIGEFFLLSLPFIVAMTMPMGVLVSTLYAFSRLAAENEISALRASGVSLARIVIPVVLAGAVVSAVMIGFNDQLLPRSNHRLRKLQTDIARKKPTFALREQIINEVTPGKLSLRAMEIDEGRNVLHDVTIYDVGDPARRRTIYADSGRMGMTPDGRDLELTLFHGHSQEIPRDNPGQLQRLFFDVDMVRIRGVANQLERSDDNYKGDREMSVCEMQAHVEAGAREREAARKDLADVMAGQVRRLALGEPPPLPTRDSAEARPPLTLGGLYCRYIVAGVTRLLSVDSAMAATPQARVRPQDTTRRQDTARRRDTARARSADPYRGIMQRPTEDLPPRRVPGQLPASREFGGRPPLSAAPSTGAGVALPGPGGGIPASTAIYATGPVESLAPFISQLELYRSRVVDAERTMNKYDVEIQKKFALAFACVVFVLIGAPIALRFPRGGVGLVIGVSLFVFALYYVGLVGGETLADRGILPPFWAMWLTNVLFTIIGFILLARMGREGATARGGDAGELWEGLRSGFARLARRVGVPLERRRRSR